MIELIAQNQNEMAQWFWCFHAGIVRAFQSHVAAAGHATLFAMNASRISRESVVAYVALGANLGDARATVLAATQQLANSPGITLLATSALYLTAPLESSGNNYINAVIKISTALPAYSLLSLLQKIEQSAGRERPYRNAPRTLDLDLLLYGSAQISSDALTVPHPRMRDRAFVLLPLQEIAPERVSAEDVRKVADQSVQKL